MDGTTTLIGLMQVQFDCLKTRLDRLVAIRNAADDLLALWEAPGIADKSAIDDAQNRLCLLLIEDRISVRPAPGKAREDH